MVNGDQAMRDHAAHYPITSHQSLFFYSASAA